MTSAETSLQRVSALLQEYGWRPNGITRREAVRISTIKSPVFGGIGGELAIFGSRTRLALPETDIKVTIGKRTVNFYRVREHNCEFLGHFNTKHFEAISSFVKATAAAAIAAREAKA